MEAWLEKTCPVIEKNLARCKQLGVTSDHIQKATRFLSTKATEADLNPLVVHFWIVMDLTFAVEEKLVEEEFPSSRKSEMQEILDSLLALEDDCLALSEKTDKLEACKDKLDDECAELLYWRVGNLVHSYAATLMGRGESVDASLAQIGVEYFQKMRTVRVIDTKNMVAVDGASLELLQEGITGDTSVLSMIFESNLRTLLGLKLGQPQFIPEGVSLMKRLIALAAGPLKDGGWTLTPIEHQLAECETYMRLHPVS